MLQGAQVLRNASWIVNTCRYVRVFFSVVHTCLSYERHPDGLTKLVIVISSYFIFVTLHNYKLLAQCYGPVRIILWVDELSVWWYSQTNVVITKFLS